MSTLPKYPGERITANGNQLVSYHTEARIADAGIFYPITPSTEGGELYQQSFAEGRLNVFGRNTLAVEAEGEHAAQGGAIAYSVCGRRVVNFTSGQGIVYGVEQYYHAPGKASTMVVEVVARALTKHALNVHCGHDDVYGALDVGWIILFGKNAQQAADQALILRRVTELSLTPGMNVQDGFLTSHLERTFLRPRVGPHPRVPRGAGGHHRVSDRGAAHALRPDPPPRAAHDRPDQPRAPRTGAEPGALYAGRRGPAQQFRRADPAVPGRGPHRVRPPDRPLLLRAGHPVQGGRRRHRVPLARLGRRELRGGGRLPAADPAAQASAPFT